MFMKSTKRAISLLMVAAMIAGNIPLAVLAEETQPVCSGQADCAAQIHDNGCEKAAVDAKTAEDQAIADTVAAQIEALPALKDIQAKPMEEQGTDYTQVNAAYDAYIALTEDQKALVSYDQEFFDPYLAYFSGQTQETAVNHSHPVCGTTCRCTETHYSSSWTAWDGTTKLYNGDYYLTQNVVLDSTIILDYSYSTRLCLNGYSITCADTVFDIYSYRSLLITDCRGKGKIETTDSWPTIGNNKYLSIWGGTILNSADYGNAIESYSGTTTYICGGKVESANSAALFAHPGSKIGIQGGTLHGDAQAIDSNGGTGGVSSLTISGGRMTSNDPYSPTITFMGGLTMTGGYVDGDIWSGSTGTSSAVSGGTIDGVLADTSDTLTITGGNLGIGSEGKTTTISAGIFKGKCYFGGAGTTTVTGGDFSNSDVLEVFNETRISGGSYGTIRVWEGELYLSGAPEINQLQVGTPSSVSAQNIDGTGSFGGDTIEVSFTCPYGSYVWKDGDVVIKNVKSDAMAERFTLAGDSLDWMRLQRSGNNLIVRVLPHGTCGDNLTWKLEDGILTISGTGPMYNYASNNNSSTAPWASYLDDRTIQKVIISEGVTTIGDYAFYTTRSSTALTELVLSDSVTSIGMFAFSGCNSLGGSLSLQNVTEIGHSAFRQTQFSTITLGDHLTTIGNYVFADNTALKEINIPANVSKIGIEAFYGCIALEKLALADGLHTIQRGAFRKCSSLKSVTIPATVTDVGIGVFEDCSKLEQATILGSDPNLEQNLFRNCTSLKHVDIPDSVTLIMTSTFAGCTSLEEITIPASVTMMYDATFSGCTNLKVVIFEGDAPVFYTDHFKGTTVTAFYPSAADGWNADTMKQYGGTVTWEAYCKDGIHNYTESVVHADYLKAEATCTAQAEYYKSCVCGAKGTESFYYGEKKLHVHDQEKVHADYLKAEATCTTKAEYYKSCVCGDKGTATFFYGEPAGHAYAAVVTVPQCEEKGFTTHTCANCSDSYIDTYTDPLNHKMGEWSLVTEPAPGAEGQERSDCSRCDHFETRAIQYRGNALILDGKDFAGQTTIWIDGIPYPIQQGNGIRYVELPTTEDCMIVTYTYHVGDEGDVHTQYPTGMKVYKVSGGVMKHIPELDNLLQYSGSSIRITGKKGIRMITSVDKTTKTALTGKGLAGYKLVEYGTALCWASELSGGKPMVLGKDYVKSNYAYKKGVADPVFAYSGNLVQYTNVLVGFNLNQCKDDIAMRPYIILEDANGKQVTLYGGIIYRSIGYIAYQNRNVFKPGNASYNYVWEIIHHVYGNKYDADYKG